MGVRLVPYAVLALVLAAPLHAQEREEHRDGAFRKGSQHLGLVGGYGNGLQVRSESTSTLGKTEMVALFPSWGVGLTDPLAAERWYGGNLEVLVEGTVLFENVPRDGFAAGGGLLFRYNFLRAERLVPFVEVGAGALDLDFDLDEGSEGQAGGFNFTLQAGLGAHWLLHERVALTGEWRFHHISNADLREPNDGIDSSVVLLGLTYFLD